MDNKINFMARSNAYLAITKKGWESAIPNTAYKQIDANRGRLEKFARKNNLKITFTDGVNMLPELHSGNESRFLSDKLAMEVEKKPSLVSKIKTVFSNLENKILHKDSKPKLTLSTVTYYEKDSKHIPVIKRNEKMGLFVKYEPAETHMDKGINFDTVVDFLQKISGNKSAKL